MSLFNEQIYNSTNRTYYHGSVYGSIDKSLAKFSCFYITLEPLYAIYMSRNTMDCNFGKVYKVKLLEKLNIFNPKANNDRNRLMDILTCTGDFPVERDIYNSIQENDWIHIFGDIRKREMIVNILKELKYDGWFNYKLDMNYQMSINQLNCFNLHSIPCVGLFSTDNIEIEEIDFHDLPEYKKQRQKDFDSLLIDATIAYKSGEDYIKVISRNFKNPTIAKYGTLEDDDVINWTKSFNPNSPTNNRMLEYAKSHNGRTGIQLQKGELRLW